MALVKWGDELGASPGHPLLAGCDGTLTCVLTSLFSPQYVGSLDVPRPNSRVEIVAAMRRIRVSAGRGGPGPSPAPREAIRSWVVDLG